MKIISLNVNNFGGTTSRPRPDEYKTDSNRIDWIKFQQGVVAWRNKHESAIEDNVKNMMKIIQNHEIVVLQEVDTNCQSFEILTTECEKNHFEIVFPNEYNEKTFEQGYNSITCMLIKNYIKYNRKADNFSKDVQKQYKNVDIEVGDLRVLGVHIPKGDIKYWDKLIKTVEKAKKENINTKILVIGDMNVCDFGTEQKERYLKLLNKCNMIDSWAEIGNDIDKATCNTMRRLDYAIVNSLLMECIYDVEIIDIVRNNGYTDHSAISIKF